MYVLMLNTWPGGREQMIDVLRNSAADMPGCISYFVGHDLDARAPSSVTEL
jgi:hypothetical protein